MSLDEWAKDHEVPAIKRRSGKSGGDAGKVRPSWRSGPGCPYLGRPAAKPNGNPVREVGLRQQGSAEAIVPLPSQWEGPNVEEGRNLDGSWGEHRRQTSPQGDLLGGWRW